MVVPRAFVVASGMAILYDRRWGQWHRVARNPKGSVSIRYRDNYTAVQIKRIS
jgi:hypothetical protein